MKHLDDEQLRLLLREIRAIPPAPPAGCEARAMQAYSVQLQKPPFWRRVLVGTVHVPVPVALVAAAALVWVGAVLGVMTRESAAHNIKTPALEQVTPAIKDREHLSLNVAGLRPVAELHPRIVRSGREVK